MKVLMINSVCGIGSTGRICTDLAQQFERDGHEVKIAYGREQNVPEQFQKYGVRIGTDLDVKLHGLRTRILDQHGFGSRCATKEFLKWAEEYKPDLLWLHNIHGYYINVEMLFMWIKRHPEMEVKWTLHDCWAFTGHCSYFTMAACDKWKIHCDSCPQKEKYPTSKGLDNSNRNFDRKRKAFLGVKKLTLITPSKWLADLVKQSYLAEYPVEVHYNKIDTSIFKPTPSDFRKKYGLEGKKIILGVASVWDERKGLDDFIELVKMLTSRYAILLVGLSKEQINEIPEKIKGLLKVDTPSELITIYNFKKLIEDFDVKKADEVIGTTQGIIFKNENGMVVLKGAENIRNAITTREISYNDVEDRTGIRKLVCVQKTNNAVELAKLYTIADYFVNPTYEDNYPTVNLEAKACGVHIITYDTGGCIETLK